MAKRLCLCYIAAFFCVSVSLSWVGQTSGANTEDPFESPALEDEFATELPQGTAEEPWGEEEFGKPSPFQLHGRIWNKYGHDIEDDSGFEDDDYNHAELRLEAKYVPNQRIHAVLSVDADYYMYGNNDDWDYDDDVRIYNAYIALSGSKFNLKVGNQMVKWGKTDEVSPLDNINPEDFRDGFVRRREERKVPIPMVNLELYEGLYKLQTLFIPVFEESDLDIVGRDWALLDHFEQEIGTFRVKEEDYPKNFKNSDAGVRLSGTITNLDYAFSYLYARDHLPSLGSLIVPAGFPLPFTSATFKDLAEFARTTDQPIELSYDRRSITGLEFETTWGDFGLRGDIAYIHERTFMTDALQSIKKPVFQYVLGADYNGPNAFYCNLQFSQAIVYDYDDSILLSEEITNTLYGEITKGILDDNVKLGLRYYYGITGKDYYYRPSILLKYWQNLKLEFGAEILGGPDDTILGVFQDNDQVYGILKIDF